MAKLRPGMSAPKSGQYQTIGPKGGKGNEITSIAGNILPPTPKAGSSYVLVDPTKHKN
ncbi:hypothetical protein [Dyadobacter linearis]|uniref:hypothetical protein n=1 Tax=Dyadobacter linearis TaxID=2823330 RepID=UPI001BFC4D60|nr:hypothetical protein [Dyadobacter sp. CECT 9623]